MGYGKTAVTVLLILLIIISVYDIRYRSIPIWCIMAGFSGAVIYIACTGNVNIYEIVLDVLPGAVFILIAFCTREKVGYGDGLVVLIMGIVMHADLCIFALTCGLIISAIFSAVMVASRRLGLRAEIPFVPFLTLGTGVAVWLI